MKLFYSPTSPFVRKVMVCAITREIQGQITLLTTNAHSSPPDLLAANPLSKVPCLVTVDGVALFDSPVICEFLDSVGEARPMFPEAHPARWRALKLQALGDGIMDAAVLRRGELARPREDARDAFIARQQAAILRGLDELERDIPHRVLDIGTITIGCMLGYLDFRCPWEPWRDTHPRLATWFKAAMQEPGLARTVPADPV